MPKSRKRKPKKTKPLQPQPQVTTPQSPHILRKILPASISTILGLLTIFGSLLSALAFLPRPTVEIGAPVEPSNPLSTTFTIKNGNITPLEHVNVSIFLANIITSNGVHMGAFWVAGNDWKSDYLGPNEGLTIDFGSMIGCHIPRCRFKVADIAVDITYRPWFLPFQRQKRFRFVAKPTPSGGLASIWEERSSENGIPIPDWLRENWKKRSR